MHPWPIRGISRELGRVLSGGYAAWPACGISRELGSATEEIEATFNAFDPLEICFNSRYLLEILKEIETPQVKLLLAESNSSTIIQPINTDSTPDVDMVFAIMPIEVVKN